MEFGFVVILGMALLFVIILANTAVVVPQQNAYVVERLGKYSGTIGAGFHVLLPFVDNIRYKFSLKEQTLEIRNLICTSRDNRNLQAEGLLRFKILDPRKAAYQVQNWLIGLLQLTQAVLRREIGRLEAGRAREDWAPIAAAVIAEVARAAEPWGIEVLRFELENLTESLPS